MKTENTMKYRDSVVFMVFLCLCFIGSNSIIKTAVSSWFYVAVCSHILLLDTVLFYIFSNKSFNPITKEKFIIVNAISSITTIIVFSIGILVLNFI